jgi:hypothetical protein
MFTNYHWDSCFLLGFTLEGSFGAIMMATYGGYVPMDSFFAQMQRIGTMGFAIGFQKPTVIIGGLMGAFIGWYFFFNVIK